MERDPASGAEWKFDGLDRGFVAFGVALVVAHALLGVARYEAYANETFDLAFYTRIAWGFAHGDLYEPILGAHVFGLRLAPVLVPLGLLGRFVSTPLVLYLAQGLAVGLALPPLARHACARLGRGGAAFALAFALHPNLGHVIAYEFHPGTVALLPLTYLALALARADGAAFLRATVGVLLCREDLLILPLAAAPLLAWRNAGARRYAALAGIVSLAWLGLFLGVLHPRFRPAQGSMEAHFGHLGRSGGEIVANLFGEPWRLARHFAATKRLTYLPRVLGPLALLPLAAPRQLIAAAPVLAICLLSSFPTTTRIDSHYFTPALPFLVVGAIEAAASIGARPRFAAWGRPLARIDLSPLVLVVLLAATSSYVVVGRISMRTGFGTSFVERAPSRAISALLAEVPREASVEAPDALLPHLAERRVVHRQRGFAGDDDAIVLDVGHRARFEGSEDLLRTSEEPIVRAVLARPDRRLAASAGPYWLFLRARPEDDPFEGLRLAGPAVPPTVPAQPLTRCLGVLAARRSDGGVAILLRANEPCAPDLALRLGGRRVDLLFGGRVSPARLQQGDLVLSHHAFDGQVPPILELAAIRSSGARPDPGDPSVVPVHVR